MDIFIVIYCIALQHSLNCSFYGNPTLAILPSLPTSGRTKARMGGGRTASERQSVHYSFWRWWIQTLTNGASVIHSSTCGAENRYWISEVAHGPIDAFSQRILMHITHEQRPAHGQKLHQSTPVPKN